MTAATCASAQVRPLLAAGRRIIVDGHAICDACGGAVRLVGPQQWRHASGRLVPPTPAELRACGIVSEDEWREGNRRLEAYRARLAALRKQPSLAPEANPYLDMVSGLAGGLDWRLPSGLGAVLEPSERRKELASLFSWAIPTDDALALIGRRAPLVEGGAGMGYWAALLRARGHDILAYDSAPPGSRRNAFHRQRRPPWTRIDRGTSVEAARRHPERTLLLCWPPYDDDAASYAALRAYRGEAVIYIGEPGEGATGSVRFARELALNWTLAEEADLPHWPRLRDRVMVYRRNPQRRPHLERDRCFECRRYMPTGAIGRCDACFALRPPALALRSGRHRVEYPREAVDRMPPALRLAFERSPNRIR
jgi:hypothetical protein